MDFQFADGAEYRIAAIAYVTGGQMIRTEQNVSVAGVEPPARAMIPAIGFFLAVIALGLAVGSVEPPRSPVLAQQAVCVVKNR